MSLDFNFSNTELWRTEGKDFVWLEFNGENYLRPEVNYVVWASLVVGINRITEKNVQQFIDRCKFMDAVEGRPLVQKQGDDGSLVSAFDEGIIRRMVGFSSNASPKSKAMFVASTLRVAGLSL